MNNVGTKWNESGSNEEKLQQIIIQKWIANFPLSTEAWAEYRRTGYPKLFPNYINNSDGTIDTNEQIRRLIYSNNEVNTNNAELQNGIQLLNQENTRRMDLTFLITLAYKWRFISKFAGQIKKNKNFMITSDQLHNVLEREQALRGYL